MLENAHEGFLSCHGSQGNIKLIGDLEFTEQKPNSYHDSARESPKSRALSGSEFDQLEAQIEQFISDDDDQKRAAEQQGLTPTEPVLLSQHAEVLRQKVKQTDTPPNPVQNIEEILGDPPA